MLQCGVRGDIVPRGGSPFSDRDRGAVPSFLVQAVSVKENLLWVRLQPG